MVLRSIIRAPARSTAGKKYLAALQETTNSSAWNHIFNFQRRGPPRRRARKLLSLCHTLWSAPRSPYLPCHLKKSSELEQNYGMSYRKNLRGRGGSSCRFDRKIAKKMFFFVGNATPVLYCRSTTVSCGMWFNLIKA